MRHGRLTGTFAVCVALVTIGAAATAPLPVDASSASASRIASASRTAVAVDDAARQGVQDQEPVVAGRNWERRTFAAFFSLPDMTLELSCVAVGTGLAVASFRGIQLAVTKREADG